MNPWLAFFLGIVVGEVAMLFIMALLQANADRRIEKKAKDIINSPDNKWTNEQIGEYMMGRQ